MTKQYPPQTGPYIVKIKSGQSTDNWQDFDTARLQISVGQEYHEGAKLAALSSWCKHRFNKVVLCVNDTLQRFNLMFEKSIKEEKAKAETSKLGKEWAARAIPVISGIPNVQIVHWEEWKAQEGFQKGRLSTEWLYANNNEFKDSIDKNVTSIWERRAKAEPAVYTKERFDSFTSLSRQYLLEEITCFALMFEKEEAIDIYPGTTLFAATKFKGQTLKGAPSGMEKGHFCRVDFSKNKAYEI